MLSGVSPAQSSMWISEQILEQILEQSAKICLATSAWNASIIRVGSSTTSGTCKQMQYVADDFGYVCLDKGKRRLVNVVEGFQAQRGDKSRATLQTMMETAHSLLFPYAGDWAALRSHQGSDGSQEDKLGKLWTLQEGLYTTCIYWMTHPRVIYYDS